METGDQIQIMDVKQWFFCFLKEKYGYWKGENGGQLQ